MMPNVGRSCVQLFPKRHQMRAKTIIYSLGTNLGFLERSFVDSHG
jgi:hypothetical protein